MVNPNSLGGQLTDQIDELRKRFKRFLTAGNAGGAIATFGLIGTAMGASDAGTAPRPMFWVFVVFLCGLLGIWFALVAEGYQLAARQDAGAFADGRAADGDEWTEADRETYQSFDRRFAGFRAIELIAISIGSLCLIGGTILGLVRLWHLTA